MKKFTDTKQKSYAASRRRRARRFVNLATVTKMKVKKGDTVIVLSGKDKGKKGEVLKALPKDNRVVVDGVNIIKRSLRKTGRGQSGRIIERPASVHASNVKRVDGSSKKPAAKKSAK